MSIAVSLFLLTIGLALPTNANNTIIEKHMQDLQQDLRSALAKPPEHFDMFGRPLPSSPQTRKPTASEKATYRKQLCPHSKPGQACQSEKLSFKPRAEIDNANQVKRFFGSEPKLQNISDLDAPELKFAKLESQPWSGDYWATYRTGLAKRFNDSEFPNTSRFDDYINFFKNLTPIDYKNRVQTEKLSPAEKYDLLMGDSNWGLSNWSLNQTKIAYKEDGTPHTWFGLCHGWAPAAYRVPRPNRAFVIQQDEISVQFFPDDVKALATLLWAQAPVPARFLGGRCDLSKPEMDENGRLKSPQCFDVNPGSWHIVLLNRLAVEKKSFVIDATFDMEVWNQPVVSFEIKYFNPKTQATEGSPESLAVAVSEYPEDVLKSYRSKKSKSIVGVMLEINYMVETRPHANLEDNEGRDRVQMARYFYDLELDSQGKIIGGEWHHNAHPDFVWTPYDEIDAKSPWDVALKETWNAGSDTPPAEWSRVAPEASRRGAVLSQVVNELVKRAR